jgi:putative ABC transport system permease protein
MTLFSLAVRNLSRTPLRTVLLLVTVAASFLVLLSLTALQTAYNATASKDARLIVTNAAGYFLPLPVSIAAQVARVKGVEQVGVGSWFGAYFKERANSFTSFAVDAMTWLHQHPEMVLDDGARQAFLSNKQGMLIGQAIADRFGWRPGQRVNVSSLVYASNQPHGSWELVIEGIFRRAFPSAPENYALLHASYFDDARAAGKGSIGFLVVTTQKGVDSGAVALAIDRLYANSASETITTSEDQFFAAFNQQFGDVRAGVLFVILAAFAATIVVTGSAFMLGVIERHREFSTLKAIGFRSSRVIGIVMTEAALLIGCGALIGAAAARCSVWVLVSTHPDLLPGEVRIGGTDLMRAAAFAVAVTVIVATIPMVRVLRLPAADELARC